MCLAFLYLPGLFVCPTLHKLTSISANHCICKLSAFRALGVPVTDHTYEDCRLMISAGELTLPMEAGLVEFTKISRKLK